MATKVNFKVKENYSIQGKQMECIKACQFETLVQTKYVVALMCYYYEVLNDNGKYDHLESEHYVVLHQLSDSGRAIKVQKVFCYGSFEYANAYYTNLIKALL